MSTPPIPSDSPQPLPTDQRALLDGLQAAQDAARHLADQIVDLGLQARLRALAAPPKALLTVRQAARLYRIRPMTIRDAIADGRLPTVRRPGGRHLLRVEAVDAVFGRSTP